MALASKQPPLHKSCTAVWARQMMLMLVGHRAALRAAAGELLQQEQDQGYGVGQQTSIPGEVRKHDSQTMLGTQGWLSGVATPLLLHQVLCSGADHHVERMLKAGSTIGQVDSF